MWVKGTGEISHNNAFKDTMSSQVSLSVKCAGRAHEVPAAPSDLEVHGTAHDTS